MDINGVCHIVFCGRLEARFPGRMIFILACPGSGLAKPCKSRLFAPNCPQQTSFSVHFLFSAACELWRHSRGSILPGWILGRTHRRRPHSVSSPYPGKSPLPASRPAARPPSGTTYSRPRKKSSAGRCRCPHRQGQCSSRPHSSSTPGVSGRSPVSSVPVSCGKGNRPACVPGRQSFIWVLSHAFPPFCFPLPFSPKRFPAPFLRRVPALARSPQLRDILSEVRLLAVLPLPGYSFSDGHSVFKVQLIDELP